MRDQPPISNDAALGCEAPREVQLYNLIPHGSSIIPIVLQMPTGRIQGMGDLVPGLPNS